MGALEEAHLAAVAACGCDDDEEDEDLVELVGGGEAPPGDAMEAAVRALLVGLGEDHRREGLRRTPKRVAKAFRDGTRGYKQKVKDIVQGALFPEVGVDKRTGSAGGTGGQVVVRDIDLFSYCESCLLPFSIQCHVGYVPSGGRVVGLSKLSRVADVFAKRFQNPQRLANEVCSALHASIQPAGVAVAVQCWHIPLPENLKCKSSQGLIRASHSSRSGVFEGEDSSFWNDFVALLKLRGIDMEMDSHSAFLPWCPLRPHEFPLCNGHGKRITTNGAISPKSGSAPSNMVSAVSSMLLSLGEDPLRKELLGSPQRYVQWLMRFRACNLDVKLNGFTLNSASVYDRPSENLLPPFLFLPSPPPLPFHRSLPTAGAAPSNSAMPKGAKKRAKLKKKQQGGHPAGSDGGANNNNGTNNSSHGDAASDGNHLTIPLNIPPVDASEDSMESSEEMVTPRAEADEEEKKAASSEVPVEVVEADGTGEEPEVQDVVVSEAPEVLQPEARSEEVVVRETAKVHPVHQPQTEAEEVVVRETATASVVQEPEAKGEVSRSLEAAGAQTTEVPRGPAVAVAASQHRATWWNCCGVFDAFAGSER